jgi:transposase
LSETGRLRLARCIVEDGWSLRRAAERFQVAVTTAQRWARRYREQGPAGMADRSSRPHRRPNQTPTRTERRIIKVRVIKRWGPARIAYLLGLNVSTVHKVLSRYKLARLRWLDRPTGRVIRRMTSAAPGDLVHVDVKKLGKIPAGGGWRMLGRTQGNHNSRADKSSGRRSKWGDPLRGHHFPAHRPGRSLPTGVLRDFG